MHGLTRRATLAAGALAPAGTLLASRAGRAQPAPPVIRIGVLSDFSGPFRDWGSTGSVACVQQAIEDLQLRERDIAVEVVQGDHQNKPDLALAMVREWFDQRGVDMVCDVNNSAIAFAVSRLARERDKVLLASATASAALTAEHCSPNTVHWTYDTWMLSRSTATATVRAGGDAWFIVTADFAFGHQMERDATRFVQEAGGRVLGSVRFPFPQTTDFSSFLLQAQASRAKVLGLATGGFDTINCIKQAHEFGLPRRGMRMALLLGYITDVHVLGLAVAQGSLITEAFYWDLNDRTRAFLRRVRPKTPAIWPNHQQAGAYSAALHYLKAVADLGPTRAKASGLGVVERMKAMPTDDDAFGPGTIRADGRKLHPAHLFQVKRPEESSGPWDYYSPVSTTPAEEAFRPLAEGACALLRG